MMSESKCLLIPGDFPPVVSGIATYFFEIWKNFPTQANNILAPKAKGWQSFDQNYSLKILRRWIPIGNSTGAKLAKGLLHTFWALILHLKYRFRIIHCGQVLSSGITGWILNKLCGVPYLVYVYGSETFRFGNHQLFIRAIKKFLLGAQYIIPNSRFTMQEFIQIGIPEKKFNIVTPGVDTSRFSPTDKNSGLLEKYGLHDKTVLLTVARLDERKGHDSVIRALARLKTDYPDLVYLIVGQGREEARLKQLCANLEVSERVIFCGYVPDELLADYYNLCDIFILLNRQTTEDPRLAGDYEGFGIVFLEAAACGKPVIAGNFGGIADAIEHGKSGYIVDGNHLAEITDTIKLFIDNPKLRQQIGIYGLNRARRYFDWQIIAQKIQPYL